MCRVSSSLIELHTVERTIRIGARKVRPNIHDMITVFYLGLDPSSVPRHGNTRIERVHSPRLIPPSASDTLRPKCPGRFPHTVHCPADDDHLTRIAGPTDMVSDLRRRGA